MSQSKKKKAEKIERTERIEIRLTKDEKRKMESLISDSTEFNTIAKLFRFRMFEEDFEIKNKILVQVDPNFTNQVAKIGNNINQLTQHVNSCAKGGVTYSNAELYIVLENIQMQLTNVINNYAKQSI